MSKPRSFAEVYNDLDEELVNVFRVLRDPTTADVLADRVRLTPWSRVEFNLSYEPVDDPVERARRTIVRSFMSYGSMSRIKGRTGFRSAGWREHVPAPANFANWPDQIAAFTGRLRAVTLECMPALNLIKHQDAPDTLFYCDPPYPVETRSSIRYPSDQKRAYAHDLTSDEHRQLAATLRSVAGLVVLSGYRCDLYDRDLYPDWESVTTEARTIQAKKRTEVLWLNPACAAALELSRSQRLLAL